jgi:inorganic pyrophosphatase
MCSYGAFPQTWEDPKYVSPETGKVGDNDPMDVVDIGSKQWAVGSIVKVKVLGVIGLIDSGETDWKVVAISTEDPAAQFMEDIGDVNRIRPGILHALVEWLRKYKSLSGVINLFAFDGVPQNRAYAESVIDLAHEHWAKLIEERGEDAVLPTPTKAH